RILYELSGVSEKMSAGLDDMKAYFSDEEIENFKEQISKGDIPFSELDKQQEYVTQDFEELRNMERMFDESPVFLQKIIDGLKEKSEEPFHKNLGGHWKDIAEQSAYIYWIDEIERKHPEHTKIGTEDFAYTRKRLKELL